LARLLDPLCCLQGGKVVNADRQFKADVLIRDGLILRVDPSLTVGLKLELFPDRRRRRMGCCALARWRCVSRTQLPKTNTPLLRSFMRCRQSGRARGTWTPAASL
jgi:hypothetical protein